MERASVKNGIKSNLKERPGLSQANASHCITDPKPTEKKFPQNNIQTAKAALTKKMKHEEKWAHFFSKDFQERGIIFAHTCSFKCIAESKSVKVKPQRIAAKKTFPLNISTYTIES